MSEFRDVCRQVHQFCTMYEECGDCPLGRITFCGYDPTRWDDTTLAEVEEAIEKFNSRRVTYGQYLEQHGIIRPDSDDRTVVQTLYQTKVPMEWLK